MLRKRAAHIVGERPAGFAIDAHDLLLGRVHAAGENARLDRRPVVLRAHDLRAVDGPREASRAGASLRASVPTMPASARRAPSAATLLAALPAPPGNDLRGVVLEDEHRRLARDARDLAVDELVGDEVADDQHPSPPKASISDRSRDWRSASPGSGMHRSRKHRDGVGRAMSRGLQMRGLRPDGC